MQILHLLKVKGEIPAISDMPDRDAQLKIIRLPDNFLLLHIELKNGKSLQNCGMILSKLEEVKKLNVVSSASEHIPDTEKISLEANESPICGLINAIVVSEGIFDPRSTFSQISNGMPNFLDRR